MERADDSTFYRIDFLRVVLQAAGRTPGDITAFLDQAEKTFAPNHRRVLLAELSEAEKGFLRAMLGDNSAVYLRLATAFFRNVLSYYPTLGGRFEVMLARN